MSAFQHNRQHTEQKVLVELLSEIERGESITQRGLANQLGIALGLMNQYLKSCVAKGWVRATQVSPKRISYFLTPVGFHEKSQMVKGYLARSFTFFRDAKIQCEQVFSSCIEKGWLKVALVGGGDLCEIAHLVASDGKIELMLIEGECSDLSKFDAVLITDIINPQGTYDFIKKRVNKDRIFILDILHISGGGAL